MQGVPNLPRPDGAVVATLPVGQTFPLVGVGNLLKTGRCRLAKISKFHGQVPLPPRELPHVDLRALRRGTRWGRWGGLMRRLLTFLPFIFVGVWALGPRWPAGPGSVHAQECPAACALLAPLVPVLPGP